MKTMLFEQLKSLKELTEDKFGHMLCDRTTQSVAEDNTEATLTNMYILRQYVIDREDMYDEEIASIVHNITMTVFEYYGVDFDTYNVKYAEL